MSRNLKIILSVLIIIAAIMGIATGIMSYNINDDIDGKIFAPAKYYEQYMIGADRANDEQMDKRFYISDDMIMSVFFDDGINNTINMQSQLSLTDDYNELLPLVIEKLPALYSQLKIRQVYAGTLMNDLTAEKDVKMFIRFSNGALIYAWLPCNGDYYAHEVCSLKTVRRNVKDIPDGLSISSTMGYTDCENVAINVIEADYIISQPYVRVLWTNNTDKAIEYGEEYKVYHISDGKIQCEPTIDNLAWSSILNILQKGAVTRVFNLNYYDLSEPGIYSIEFNFNFEGEDTIHTAVIQFEIGETPESFSKEFATSEAPEFTTKDTPEFTTSAVSAYSFNAKVIEINKHNILVEPLKIENEYKSADRIYVSTSELYDLPDLFKGAEITITYNGQIMEKYPAQLSEVYSIKIAE